jgi:flavin reductase (DIM6/NTAB) family NADH-FMN oxidoreductase RutF
MNLSDKKRALRMFQYGLFIFTSKATDPNEKSPYAASTVTWVSQASFEPPLLMLALRKESWTNEAVRQSRKFVLNILNKNQKNMAGKFFKEIKVVGNKINGFEFEIGATGAPVLTDAAAFVECEVEERIEKGDHSVLIGRIINAKVSDAYEEPMLLRETGWNYGG